jgi:hypothetical protein
LEMNPTLATVLYFVLVAVFIALAIYMRRKRSTGNPLMDVARIYVDIKRDDKLVNNFDISGAKLVKFKTGAWKKNQDKVGFLPEELRKELSLIFTQLEGVNTKIEDAKKYKSTSYLVDINVSNLVAPIASSRAQLNAWFKENMYNPAYQPKRRSLFR